MKQRLVDERQPFGMVYETTAHPTDGNPVGTRNTPHEGQQVMNNGLTQHPSDAAKNPYANAQASRNGNQPFAFVGENFGRFK